MWPYMIGFYSAATLAMQTTWLTYSWMTAQGMSLSPLKANQSRARSRCLVRTVPNSNVIHLHRASVPQTLDQRVPIPAVAIRSKQSTASNVITLPIASMKR
jgi:hypothetical protein